MGKATKENREQYYGLKNREKSLQKADEDGNLIPVNAKELKKVQERIKVLEEEYDVNLFSDIDEKN